MARLVYEKSHLAQKPARQKIIFIPPPPHKRFDSFMLETIHYGQTFRPGCQVQKWILHIKIQNGIQNGHQKDEFSNSSHIGVKDLHKYTHFYVVLLRSNL